MSEHILHQTPGTGVDFTPNLQIGVGADGSATERQNEALGFWQGETLATKALLSMCRWIPYFRGKGRIFQQLVATLFHGRLSVRNSLGARLQIDPSDYIGRTISFEGSFELKSLACAAAIMQGGGVFLDIGCNFGLYTVALGGLSGVECIAIDGSFVALSKLLGNLELNSKTRARLVNTALCCEDRLLCFEVPTDGNLGGTHVTEDEREGLSRFWVSGVVLDRVLDRLSPSRIKLLKIDVEGSEMSVFAGLDLEGPHRPDNIIVECYTELFPEAASCIEYLERHDYEALTVEGKRIRDFNNLPENNVWLRSTR